ncbi:MAG: glycosyltransferase family 4 protein [Bacteroidales bacterium]|nr:glycosyltransferase family 4 protein [Bacteroidales bacterium]
MKIAYIATYPPKKCGIGTFTNNLLHSVISTSEQKRISEQALVVALDDEEEEFEYPEEVKYTIRTNHQKDYIKAARFINFSGADVVVLQHEFGIFGGEMGVYILPLLHHLTIPLVTVCHTVLKNPSYIQRSIISEIGKRSSRVIVMSHLAVDFLKNIYKIPGGKIKIIEHGTPTFKPYEQNALKKSYKLKDRTVLLTFGLLSRNKGIETVLHALPEVVKNHPEVMYIILGATHPAVLRLSGEEYKEYLKMLVNKYGLENNVFFYDKFVSEETLVDYLSMADIYVTPYLTKEQITSGTLSYAVGAGSCVLSTPYWHAQELLAKGRGILFDFKIYDQLAEIITELLDNPDKLEKIRKKAFAYGKKLTWPKNGKVYLDLFKEVQNKALPVQTEETSEIDLTLMPKFNLAHIYRLTDDVGIVQNALYGIPNLKHGYNLSDNSRAVLMTAMVYKQYKDQKVLDLLSKYLSYVHYMQNEDGSFHNGLSFDRTFQDEQGTEDSFGRTIWALGYLVKNKPFDSYKQVAKGLLNRSVDQFEQLNSLRGIATTVIGLIYFLQEFPEKEQLFHVLRQLTKKLTDAYEAHKEKDWEWFEYTMTYDNGILPLALFLSYEASEDEHVLKVARESTNFLTRVTLSGDYFAPVGNKGWYQKGGEISSYNQQSVEAMSMVQLFYHGYRILRDKSYLSLLFKCYMWYLGNNTFHIPLYEHETGGCYDGLIYKGVNKNEGAESTISYLISHITVLQAHQLEYFNFNMNK